MRKLFVIAMTVVGLTAFAAGASAGPCSEQIAHKDKSTTTVAKGTSDQSNTSKSDS